MSMLLYGSHLEEKLNKMIFWVETRYRLVKDVAEQVFGISRQTIEK
jgi:hypothetical protein